MPPRMSSERPKFNKALLPIFLIVAVDVMGMTLILPLLPFYAERYGATPQVVGFLVTTYALCQLIAGPILGRLSDRHGRRPWLIVSQLGTFAGFLILGWARSLFWIFFSRFLDGITAGNLSLAQAYIADVTAPEERAKSFGVIGIAFGLGFLIGPALSGFLAQYDYSYPAWAAACLSFTSVLCTWFLLPRVKPHAEEDGAAGPGGKRLALLDWGAYAKYFERPGLGATLLEFFLFCVMFSLFISGFALFAERRFVVDGRPFGPKEVGYLYAYSGLLGVVIQGGLLGRMVKRFGERALARAGFLSAAVGLALLAFITRVPLLVPLFTLTAFGTGVLRPALTSLVTRAADKREQGVVLGLTQSLNSIAQILAPLLAGFLIGRGRLGAWALTAAGVSTLGFLLIFRAASAPHERRA
jgi:DHA1 family tetracycline resistance protein-like MFS transporter